MHRLTLASALLLPLTLAAGCTLDSTKMAKEIEKGLGEQGVTVKNVVCPTGKKDKDGETFECDGQDESGTMFKVSVAAKGGGNVTWNVIGRVVEPSELEGRLAKKSGRTFDCGDHKRIVVKGTEIDCKEGATVVAVRFTDNEGDAEIIEK